MSHLRLDSDGGSAFARPPTDESYGSEGMSLRDYFAGQALAGRLVSFNSSDSAARQIKSVAKTAYEIADAMIAARG